MQADHAAVFLFVFDHQDRWAWSSLSIVDEAAGKRETRCLRPGVLSTVIWPPCSSTIFEHDRQAQADAFGLGGEERVENAFEILRVDAGAAIDDRDLHLAVVAMRVFTVTTPPGGLACAAFISRFEMTRSISSASNATGGISGE